MGEKTMFEVFVGHRVVDSVGPTIPGPDIASAITADRLEQFLGAQGDRRALALADLDKFGPATGAPPPYMLTFDDGFQDFATNALPILERRGVPALVFVTTGWAEGRETPYEYVLGALIAHADKAFEWDGDLLPTATREERQNAYEQLRLLVKKATPDERNRLLARVGMSVGVAPKEVQTPPMLTTEELRELDRHELVTIGAHSVCHRDLSACEPGAVWAETRGSGRALARMLGHPVDAFAYPYGAQTRSVRLLTRLAGYRWGFTTEPTPVRRLSLFDRVNLPRMDLAAWMPEL